ncbi:serine/threonine-protein kinase [Marinicella gelatinilytica]|uniref:serine/threonine-protein kinase n=1 Tax=Marinicella gelatinilytica TaxID=2996017 RepID=UPI002260EBF7|nr:serine/threonine-protein kinase [Marinicella gelatinilytica]MCX7543852.1 serine/threonine-protein kinase [Marinicella gelatinilytica]
MKAGDDIERLWQQISEDFEANDDIDLTHYLQSKGLGQDTTPDSLNTAVSHLVTYAFTPEHDLDDSIQSKYKIIKQLDSGGQSDIYLAERIDGVYRQTVVIKFISGHYDPDTLKQQFMQEMQLLADLKHPGVVGILDGNVSADGKPWLVLDYIDGVHIDDYVVNNNLDTADVVSLLMNVCEILQFIHKRGVLHKDLKPNNILIQQKNKVPYPVLLDFGIASLQGETSELIFGTPAYSSPEQINGLPMDARSDIYSLGMLLGCLLLKVQRFSSFQLNHKNSRDNMLADLKRAGIDRDLQQVIAGMVATKPENRYQSADAVRSDLNLWQSGYPLSFNSHKLHRILLKSIQRHPMASLGVLLVIFMALFFALKYTRDTQHLQQLTIAEKNAGDELMNFMLDDMYNNLERIGRIDVLQQVAIKSVAYLGQQDPLTLDEGGHHQTAKAYLNAGRVFDYLEQSEQAQNMYQQAEKHLEFIRDDALSYHQLLAELKVHQAQVFISAGQQQNTQQALQQAIDAMHVVMAIKPDSDATHLWEAHLEMAYHLMEYADADAALQHINQSIALATDEKYRQNNAAQWLYSESHSYQLKAWYELDFGIVTEGIKDVQKAIEAAEKSIQLDPEDIKKQHNVRILYNQLSYFYMENQQIEAAQQAALTAIEKGRALKIKAPFNQEFERELAYSYTTAGEIYQTLGDLQTALKYYKLGREISVRNFAADQHNYSTANDLAVDSLLIGGILQQLGQTEEAIKMFTETEQMMDPIYQNEPNNKYYTHTLLVTKLQLKKFDEAKSLFKQTQNNDMVDGVVEGLLTKNNLQDWNSDSLHKGESL